jgi:hypothetical protein
MSGSRIALTIKFLRAATNPPDCGFDYQTITKLFILDLSPMGERTRGQDVAMSRDGEKAKVPKGIRPLGTRDVVCGQFRGYRDEPGVRAILR